MTTTTQRFGSVERRYFKRLETALLVAPRSSRARLLDVARQHVAERPPVGTYDELVAELGPPSEYARELMADEGVDPQPSRWRRTAARARSPEAIAGVVVALVLIGGAAWFAARWFTEVPTFTNMCGGTPGRDPRVPVEHVTAAGEDEIRIGHVDGARVALLLCLSTNHTVEVTAIEVPSAERALFQPTEVLLLPLDVEDLEDAEPFRPFTVVPGDDDPEPGEPPDPRSWWQVHVVGVLANCEHWGEGSSYSFDEATLTYRFRGRTRTTPIDLLSTYTFEAGDDEGCPRPGPGRAP